MYKNLRLVSLWNNLPEKLKLVRGFEEFKNNWKYIWDDTS